MKNSMTDKRPDGFDLSYEQMLAEAAKPQQLIIRPGSAYAESQRKFQGIPSITVAPGGRLWAIWFSGGQGESSLNHVLVVTSGDRGETWSDPVLAVDPPGSVRAYDPQIWVDPDGKLWVFWTQAHTLHDGKWGVWCTTTGDSDNPNPDWSAPRRICDGILLGKPVVLSDGEWLFPVSLLDSKPISNEVRMMPYFLRTYISKKVPETARAEIDQRHGAWVVSSWNKGATFEWKGRARSASGVSTHNEHELVERSDGTLWMLMRTAYGIGQSFSKDRGKTWSDVEESGLFHPASRFAFSKLHSGNLILVKHSPEKRFGVAVEDGKKPPRSHLTALLSTDEGKTWSSELMLQENGCSYPDLCQDRDGTIYVIYDRERRGLKKIVVARFSEEDVVAGKPVSAAANLQLVASQATGVITEEEDWSQFKGQDDPEGEMVFEGI